MIIDFHTHIFPPDVRDNREAYLRRDSTFAEMYTNPKSTVATAEDLLESMKRSGVDHSVVQGFAWQDPDLITQHNDYILEAATASNGRVIPFTNINMADPGADQEIERCASAGARGLGELRPDNQGWELTEDAGDRLAELARTHGLILLFHVTERGGHAYSGKDGLALVRFHAFATAFSDLRIVGAHLGGATYSDYTEIDPEGEPPDVYVDTAAQPFLYPRDRDPSALTNVPVNRMLFGSDFPLITQERQIAELRAAYKDTALDAVLGRNAAHLLGLNP